MQEIDNGQAQMIERASGEIFLVARYLQEGEITGKEIDSDEARVARGNWRRQITKFGELVIPIILNPRIADLILMWDTGARKEKKLLWDYDYNRIGNNEYNGHRGIYLARENAAFTLTLRISEKKHLGDIEVITRDFQRGINEKLPSSPGNEWKFGVEEDPNDKYSLKMLARRTLEPSDLVSDENRFYDFVRDLSREFREARFRLTPCLPLYTPQDLNRIVAMTQACENGISLIERAVRENQ